MNVEIINYLMPFLSLGAAICSAVAAVSSYRTAKKSLQNDMRVQLAESERIKKQATLDAYNILQSQVCDKLNSFEIRTIKNAFLSREKDILAELNGLVARIEHFCVGLELDIYDKETFYELAHGYFDEGILKERLDIIFENKPDSVEFYEHTRNVWDWMKKTERERNIVRVYKVNLNPEVEMDPREEAALARDHSK